MLHGMLFIYFIITSHGFMVLKVFVWQQSICITFILLSGFCFHFDSHPRKRGGIILALGILISVITYFIMPQNLILFGILTFLGFSILVMSFFHKIKIHLSPKLGIIVSLIGFLIFQNIEHGKIGITGIYTFQLPSYFYQNRILAFFGLPDSNFKSSDYFPFLPWFFIFLLGYYSFFIWKKYASAYDMKETTLPQIRWIGKKSLGIYMIHQPMIYVFLYLLHKIF